LVDRLDASLLVGDLDVQLLGTSNNLNASTNGHCVGDFCSVCTVVHKQKIEVLHIVHAELAEAVGQQSTGILGGSVSNLGHPGGTTELTTNPGVNTTGVTPVRLDTHKAVALPPVERRKSLLDLARTQEGPDGVGHI